MSTTTSCIKAVVLSALPSLVLGGVAFIFLALCQGGQQLGSVSGFWYFVFFVFFLFVLATKNDGRQIFARSLRYFSYQLWAFPLFVFIYLVVTGGQLTPQDKAMGQTVGTLAAIFVTGGVALVSGLVGLVCYTIANNLLKSGKKKHKRLAAHLVKE